VSGAERSGGGLRKRKTSIRATTKLTLFSILWLARRSFVKKLKDEEQEKLELANETIQQVNKGVIDGN